MTCKQLDANLDDYIDGLLGADDTADLDAHVAGCEACRASVEQAAALRRSLQDYAKRTMPKRDDAFFNQALARAAHSGVKRQQSRSWFKGFGSAVAAGLILFAVGVLFNPAPQPGDTPVPMVTMALEEPRTVNLVFSSATDLDAATLTVNLPAGIEIAGFSGQQEITWLTSLQKGKNVLPLKLIATSPEGGELLATLQHEDDDKSFRLRVTIS